MGEGWYYDFPHTHFDRYSPPDFYTRVIIICNLIGFSFEAETDDHNIFRWGLLESQQIR